MVINNFLKNLRDMAQREASRSRAYSYEDDKKEYSDAGSKKAGGDPDSLQWMSYTVHDTDNDKERRIDVGYDKQGKISGVRDFTGKNSANGYYGKEAISDFFKNNFDMDATNYTVSSAPIDIYDPKDVPDEYHNKATVFFDSKLDGAFIPSKIFSMNNYGARWLGDRKSDAVKTRPDQEVQDFIQRLRDARIQRGPIDNTLRATEINPSSRPGRA